MPNSPYFIVLMVLVAITLIAGLVFNIIFLFHRINLNNDYKLKTKFNIYKNNPIGSNLKSIENMARQNRELQPILEYLNGCNHQYSNQLEIVKIQLENVTKSLNSFKVLSTHKMLKQIKANFNALDLQQIEYKQFNLDTQKYVNNSSQISTDLFDILSSITNFNKENLINILHSDVHQLKQIDLEVNDISSQINKELNYINYTNIHNLFIKEVIKIKELYNISKNIFDIDKYIFAFDALIDKLKKQIINSKLGNDKKVIVMKKAVSSRNRTKQINELLQQSKFDVAMNIYVEESKQLEKIISDISAEETYLKIYNEHFDKFKENVMYFYNLIVNNKLKELYKEILTNFKRDPIITELIEANIALINSIYLEIDNFNKFLNRPNLQEYLKRSVEYIFKIYELMITFRNDNDKLLVLINKKHRQFLEYIIRLHDLELKLIDLDRLIIEHDVNNPELVLLTKENRNNVIEARKMVVTQELDVVSLNLEIKCIEDFITSSLEIIKINMNLKITIKRLKLYANRYYNYTTKQQLNIFDKLYKEHRYFDLIDEYINYIQKTKKQKRVS